MSEAAVTAAEKAAAAEAKGVYEKMAAFGVASLLKLRCCRSYHCFCVLVFLFFVFMNVFAFQQVVNFKCLFIEREKSNPVVGGGFNEPVLFIAYF